MSAQVTVSPPAVTGRVIVPSVAVRGRGASGRTSLAKFADRPVPLNSIRSTAKVVGRVQRTVSGVPGWASRARLLPVGWRMETVSVVVAPETTVWTTGGPENGVTVTWNSVPGAGNSATSAPT